MPIQVHNNNILVKRDRPGSNINYLNAGTDMIPEGNVVQLGDHGIGIAGHNIEPGKVGSVWIEGVFIFPKSAGPIAIGSEAFWDDSAQNITDDGDVRAGWVVQDAGAADATALVKIN